MKKRVLLCMLALLLIGCSSSKKETEPPSTEEVTTQEETESETESEMESETEPETEGEPLETLAGEEVIPSYYQQVNATWQDTYLAVLWAVQAKQEEGAAGPPYFALMQMPGAKVPMMVCGYMEDPVSGYGMYRIYGYEDSRLYELLEFRGVVTMDLAANRLAIQMDGSVYQYLYRGQNLVRLTQGELMQQIPMTQLYDVMVTIDNLESFCLTAAQ